MNRALVFSLAVSMIAIISCGPCEDKTLEISEDFFAFLSYEDETTIVMSNQENETMSFTVVSELDISEEENGDCTTFFTKSYIRLSTETQDDFIRIWGSLNEDFVLGDHEQLWFVIDDDQDDIFESGMLRFPMQEITSVTLNGTTFDEVISLVNITDDNTATAIHVQRNVGIVGYQLRGDTWVLQ